MEATIPQNTSYTWRSIVNGRRILEVGTRFRIGNEESIKFYHDRWLPLPYGFKPFTRSPEGSAELSVASFIDWDRRCWNKEMLHHHVSVYEAESIVKLPIYSSQTQDTLMWHFDKGGVYSVRSGYWAYADYMHRLHNAGSSSTNGGGSQRLWKLIWNIHIPPKVRIFAWKAISGFIPTRASLARRHVNIEGVVCLLCGDPLETAEHLFRDCCVVRSVWKEGGMHGVVDVTIRLPFIDWLHATVEQLETSQVELFFMLLWAIWYHRNKVLWDKGEFSTSFIAQWTIMQLKDYREVHEKVVSKQRRREAKWCCPPRGRLKLNIDGAYDKEKSKGGVGVIVRDDNGAGIAAIARPIEFALSPFTMDLVALREGLRLAIRQGWTDIIIESDSILLVSAMNKGKGDLSETGNIIADCLELARELGTISYCHIYREANQVADRLATDACGMEINQDWIDVMPSLILDVLLADSFICNTMPNYSINNTEERSVSNT